MNVITKEEEQLLTTIRKNPSLGRCIFEMLEISGEDLGNIDLADDAEEVVVQSIKKTGKELLTVWAQNRQNQLTDQVKLENKTRAHEKKSCSGIQH